jgi:hypothetical protein
MPNLVERLFRAMILYTGLWWIITGLWVIPECWRQWKEWDSQWNLQGNELYFALVLLLVYGSYLVVGVICVGMFRKLAARQYQLIPDIADMADPMWHDTAVFATLLTTASGLYCLDIGFRSLSYTIKTFTMIGIVIKDHAFTLHDVWSYNWQDLFVPTFILICAIVLLTQTGKIAARVTRMIDTTPLPKEESEEGGGTDEQSN